VICAQAEGWQCQLRFGLVVCLIAEDARHRDLREAAGTGRGDGDRGWPTAASTAVEPHGDEFRELTAH
jgi:hypothetical protein